MPRPARLASLLGALALALPSAARGEPRRFVLDPESSAIHVEVRRGGLFGFLGHDHLVEARLESGEVVADTDDLEAASVVLWLRAGELRVTDPEGPAQDIPEVQAKMESAEVLDVASHPRIAFRSTAVKGRSLEADAWRLEIDGELELHGVTRAIRVPLALRLVDHGLAAAGRFELKQSDWGIEPVSVAGVVKVKDALLIRFEIQGRLAEP